MLPLAADHPDSQLDDVALVRSEALLLVELVLVVEP